MNTELKQKLRDDTNKWLEYDYIVTELKKKIKQIEKKRRCLLIK